MDCSVSFDAKSTKIVVEPDYVFAPSESPDFACYWDGSKCAVSLKWASLEPKKYYEKFCSGELNSSTKDLSNCNDLSSWPSLYFEVNVQFSDMFQNVDPINCASKYVVSSSSYLKISASQTSPVV
jgi:hypothetical protein